MNGLVGRRVAWRTDTGTVTAEVMDIGYTEGGYWNLLVLLEDGTLQRVGTAYVQVLPRDHQGPLR